VRKRRFGSVVRVTVNKEMPVHIREILIENLEMDRTDMYDLEGPLGISHLMSLYQVNRYDLKDATYLAGIPVPLKSKDYDGNIFSAIRQGDFLVHHPYDSFHAGCRLPAYSG